MLFNRKPVEEGLVEPPIYANSLFGNIAGAQALINDISAILSSIPDDWTVSLAGLSRSQITANIMGITYVHGVGVGLKDNLWLDNDNKKGAENADPVSRVPKVAHECRRSIAVRGVVWEMLFHPGKN